MATAIVMAVRGVAGPERAAAISASFRSLDAGQRRAMLGSPVADVIRASDAGRPDGTRRVSLPAQAPMPPDDALSGFETVRRHSTTIVISTHAAGPIAIDMQRRVDPATALEIEQRSTRDITTAEGTRRSRADTVTTLALASKHHKVS